MLARARRGVCEIVAGAALWRCRCRSRGRRSILCIWVCVCVAGVAFGSCLEGQDVGARAAGGVRNRGRRSTLAMPLPKSWQAQHSVHLGVCLCGRGSIRQLSRGTGCCRARGGGRAKSWQAQHFGDAVASVVAGAAFCASGCGDALAEVVAGAAFCASGCVFVWQGRRSILCICVCVCVAGAAFGSCLKGQDGVARSAGGVRNRGSGDAIAEVVAGAAFCASGCVFVWQGQHFVTHSLAFILTLTHTSRMSKGSSTRLV